jgi:dihydroorotase
LDRKRELSKQSEQDFSSAVILMKCLMQKRQLITPGLVDVHVHLREPGFTYKETIKAWNE